MKIERFEDIEAWQPAESLQVERLARELTRKVYRLTKKPGFANDYRLNRQIQDAAGLSIGEFSVHRSGFLVAGTLRFCMFSTLNLERRTQEPRTSTYRPTNLKMFTNRPTEHVLPFVDSPACHARPGIYGKNGLLGMFRTKLTKQIEVKARAGRSTISRNMKSAK